MGVIALISYTWHGFSLGGAWDLVSSWTFWSPMFWYLGAGLVYSIIEFFFGIRRSARELGEKWTESLGSTTNVTQLDANGKPVVSTDPSSRAQVVTVKRTTREILANLADPSNAAVAPDLVNRFVDHYGSPRNSYIALRVNPTTLSPEPYIVKLQLTEYVGAWTIFWPFYMVSLIIGDFLTEVFSAMGDFMIKISGRFVKFAFSNTFKVS